MEFSYSVKSVVIRRVTGSGTMTNLNDQDRILSDTNYDLYYRRVEGTREEMQVDVCYMGRAPGEQPADQIPKQATAKSEK